MARGGSRSSSRGGGSSRSPPPRSSFTNTKPMPQQQTKAPQQTTQSSGGMFGGIGSTIMTGMAFGAGSQVAHQAVRGLMGSSSSNEKEVPQNQQQYNNQQTQGQNPCQINCIQSNQNLSYCQSYSDMLKQCKQNNNML